MIADGSQDPADEAEYLAAFQELVDSGLAWKLQGTIGRTAADLLNQGLIKQTVPDAKDYYGNLLPWQPSPPSGHVSIAVLGVLSIIGLAIIGWGMTLAALTTIFHHFLITN